MTSTNPPAPLDGGTLYATGTDVREFDAGETIYDTVGRIPAFGALAKATGGLYAENGLGMTVPEALEAAGLNFVVRKHGPLGVTVPSGEYIQLGDGDISDWTSAGDGDDLETEQIDGLRHLRATVATWPGQPDRRPAMLGVVGRTYPVVQPAETAAFAQQLVEQAGGNIVAICSYGDPRGSQMVMAVKLPEGLLIGGQDPHDQYAVIGNSWNRATSLWGCAAPVRFECTNQVAATFGALSSRFTIPHRGDMTIKVEEAQRALEITREFSKVYATQAEQMLKVRITGADVDRYVEALFPTPPDVKAKGVQNWAVRRAHIADVIRTGEHNTFGRGTGYAAYQGVVYFLDHMKPANTVRGRAARVVDGSGGIDRLKQRAAQYALA